MIVAKMESTSQQNISHARNGYLIHTQEINATTTRVYEKKPNQMEMMMTREYLSQEIYGPRGRYKREVCIGFYT